MSEKKLMRDALNQMLEHFEHGKPDYVLFTSFTFSATFFENNVLPLLCGNSIDQIKENPPTRDALNQQLVEMKVVVACDHSAQPEPKSNLRYGLMSVGLQRGRFHPKLILMAGTRNDGKRGLCLSVSSGNLTYSGWGINREVVGVTPVTSQHAGQLAPLLQWLFKQAEHHAALAASGDAAATTEEGDVRQVLGALLDALNTDSLPDQPAAALPALHLSLPPALKQTHPALLTALLDRQQWQSVIVISPYWGGATTLINNIAPQGAEVTFQLVPAIPAAGDIHFAVGAADKRVAYQRFTDEPHRFTHAKALLLANPDSKVLAIGSANFTTAALLHGHGYLSNVEAMLRYRVASDYDWSGLLSPLPRSDDASVADNDEGAPPLPPFQAEAVYDWRGKLFHCRVTPDPETELRFLSLEFAGHHHEFHFSSAEPQQAALPVQLRSPVRSYKLTYTDHRGTKVYIGLVAQLNADDEQLDYQPKPRLDQVLALLHGLVPGTINKRNAGSGADGGDEESDPDGLDSVEPVFDFFSFFLATEKMRRYYRDPRHRAENPLGNGRTSVYTLYRAVIGQPDVTPAAKIGRYVQLAELQATLAYMLALRPGQAAKPQAADIEQELARLAQEIAPLLQASPHWRAMFGSKLPDPATFLHWFRAELNIKTDGL